MMNTVLDTSPPAALGRGVVVAAGARAPGGWTAAARVPLDDFVRAAGELHRHWSRREPVVVEVTCDVDELREPETEGAAPYTLRPDFEFARERCYFLARANNYDDRHGRLLWTPALDARRLGAQPSSRADVELGDGTPAWLDGGPRAAHLELPSGHVLVHRNQLEHDALVPDGPDHAAVIELAPDQLEAVRHASGPARVIAPAGSGKTRVLTERLRLLTEDRRWDPRAITAVAYNVRAKDTMRERLAGFAARDRIRTLHSLGNEILRRASGPAQLLDEWEVRRRIEGLVPVRPRANTDVYAPYLEALGQVRLGLVDPQRVETQRDDVPGFATMFEQYRDKLRAENAIDHDEQIYGAIEMLLRDPKTRAALQRECRHLLVDEFQDLTPAQLLMLRIVAAPAYDVFGTGDDDQVIYGYAGADPEFLINYDRYFPGARHHALEHNYRCPPAIVDGARNLLSYNRRRIGKTIIAARTHGAADALTVTRAAPERLAAGALEQAAAWLAAGTPPEQIAVLSRVNATLLPVQLLFEREGVPCWTPVSVAVLHRTGTRTALAYLRLAIAAAAGGGLAGHDIAIAARRPSRSLRREILQRFEHRRQWRMVQIRDIGRNLNASAAEKLDDFCAAIEALGRAHDRGATTGELLTSIRDEIGLGAALATLDLSGKGPDASHRDDLNALIAVAATEPDPAGFEPWLRTKLRAPAEPACRDGVAVSTVHRVKGMEWPFVIVLGAHDGLMPHNLADDVEEERRVFHVAITRASTAVHLVADAQAPAPFLDQLTAVAPPDAFDAPRRVVPPPGKTRAPVAAPPAADLARRVDALKAWRKQRARADGVPAYVVLNDTHLAGIATAAPATLAGLAGCAGIGPTKLERYGDEIVAVMADTPPGG